MAIPEVKIPSLPPALAKLPKKYLYAGAALVVLLLGALVYFFVLPQSVPLTVSVNSAGAPLPGASVTVAGGSFSQSIDTDSDGKAFFKEVPKGLSVTITAKKEGFEEKSQKFTAGSRPLVSITLAQSLVRFSVSVVDEDSGEGLSGATLSVTSAGKTSQLETDAQGMAQVEAQELSDVSIIAVKEDYDPRTITITRLQKDIGVQKIALARSAAFLQRLANLKGRLTVSVKDEDGRGKVASVKVYSSTDRAHLITTATTGANGDAAITTIKLHSRVYLSVQADGYVTETTEDFSVDESTSQSVTLRRLVPENTTLLTINVLGTTTSASVYVLDAAGDVLANNNTLSKIEYQLERGQSVGVVVYSKGKLPYRNANVVLDQARVTVNAALNASNSSNSLTLSLTAKDFAYQQAVPNATANVYSQGFLLVPAQAVTNNNGKASISDIPLGSDAEVRVSKGPLKGNAFINESSPNLTVLLYPPTTTVTFRAVNYANNATLQTANFSVLLQGSFLNGSSCATTSGSCSRQVFVGIPLQVRVSSPGFANKLQSFQIDDDSPTSVTVKMFATNSPMITLSITDRNGVDVTGVSRLDFGSIYTAHFDVMVLNNASRVGLYVRAGNRTGNFANDSIAIVRRSDNYLGGALTEFVNASTTFNPTSCNVQPPTSAFGALKWIDIQADVFNQSLGTIGFDVEFAVTNITSRAALNFRAYQVIGNEYVREPFDAQLQTAFQASGRVWCSANTENITSWQFNAHQNIGCGAEGCVSYGLEQPLGTSIAEPYSVQIANGETQANIVVDRFSHKNTATLGWLTSSVNILPLIAADHGSDSDPYSNVDQSSPSYSYQTDPNDFPNNRMLAWVKLQPQNNGATTQRLSFGGTSVTRPVTVGAIQQAPLVNYEVRVVETSGGQFQLKLFHGNNVVYNYDLNGARLIASLEGTQANEIVMKADPITPVDAVRVLFNSTALPVSCTFNYNYIQGNTTCFDKTPLQNGLSVLSYDGSSQTCRTGDPNRITDQNVKLHVQCTGTTGTFDIPIKVLADDAIPAVTAMHVTPDEFWNAQYSKCNLNPAIRCVNAPDSDKSEAECKNNIWSCPSQSGSGQSGSPACLSGLEGAMTGISTSSSCGFSCPVASFLHMPEVWLLADNRQWPSAGVTYQIHKGGSVISDSLIRGVLGYVGPVSGFFINGTPANIPVTSPAGFQAGYDSFWKRGDSANSPIKQAFSGIDFNYREISGLTGINTYNGIAPQGGFSQGAGLTVSYATVQSNHYLDNYGSCGNDASLQGPLFYIAGRSSCLHGGSEVDQILGSGPQGCFLANEKGQQSRFYEFRTHENRFVLILRTGEVFRFNSYQSGSVGGADLTVWDANLVSHAGKPKDKGDKFEFSAYGKTGHIELAEDADVDSSFIVYVQ
ncbi:MAG TPA: carboxypeptidase regulatory-like domain-containing protein [Candidatus Norongarragalinales archaeon]|jgi:hypothetical protein|nr:carboxypeptidase regulatory-like domain-containing protein [Candidatus Norongarragalinales archaeon]